MDRRRFLKALGLWALAAGIPSETFGKIIFADPEINRKWEDRWVRDYLYKMRNFDAPHPQDQYLSPEEFQVLESLVARLRRVQRTVGHGNFHLLSFDDTVKFARNFERIGRFPTVETDFVEQIFYEDAARYGFFGDKPIKDLTDRIQKKKVQRVSRTGNYLYRGKPVETYKKITSAIGDQVTLTSGIRSITKQLYLFLNKAHETRGNLSMTSRSLAPPGYSYHGIGDFDVGQVGYGALNFTGRFTSTDVFKKLNDLGYVSLRYREGNMLGVRFEPWHVKVSS